MQQQLFLHFPIIWSSLKLFFGIHSPPFFLHLLSVLHFFQHVHLFFLIKKILVLKQRIHTYSSQYPFIAQSLAGETPKGQHFPPGHFLDDEPASQGAGVLFFVQQVHGDLRCNNYLSLRIYFSEIVHLTLYDTGHQYLHIHLLPLQ